MFTTGWMRMTHGQDGINNGAGTLLEFDFVKFQLEAQHFRENATEC